MESLTKVLINRSDINIPIDEPTILQLPIAYRTDVACNRLGLLEGIHVWYESIFIVP